MAREPPIIRATPMGTPSTSRSAKARKLTAAIMTGSAVLPDGDEVLEGAPGDDHAEHRHRDGVPPLRNADARGRDLVLVVVPRELAAERRQDREGDDGGEPGEQGKQATPCLAAAVEEHLDPDVAVAHDGGAGCHEGEHYHQADRDLLGPGEGLAGEVAHQ